jgi:hypothetical protein
MGSPSDQALAATRAEPDPASPAADGQPLAFPAEEARQRADAERKVRQIEARARKKAERQASFRITKLAWSIERKRLARARIDSTEATRAHDRKQRKQIDETKARERVDELRIEAYRDHNRFRFMLVPAIYVGIAALAIAVATGTAKPEQLQLGIAAVGGLIYALLRDRFGLSLRTSWRAQILAALQRRTQNDRSELHDVERLLMQDIQKESRKRQHRT